MPSPFPGMDPYLESPAHWSDFHGTFVPALRDAINQRLPKNYIARIGEHVSVIAPIGAVPPGDSFIPDVAVIHRAGNRSESTAAGAALLEPPEATELENVEFSDQRIETYVKIVRLPDQDLVTVVELLSPTNKYGEGRGEYMQKRRELRMQSVNLVELDLLRAGQRIEFDRPLPAGHYFAFVTRGSRSRITTVHPWSIRDPMPAIPIPLKELDAELLLPTREPFALTYARGRYDEIVDYSVHPPPPAFASPLQEWVISTSAKCRG